MKLFISFMLTIIFLSSNLFASKHLDEKHITKLLNSVNIAKEHKNIKAMKKYFLSHASVSITNQKTQSSKTVRMSFNEYKRYLKIKWKKIDTNRLEVKKREFKIGPKKRSALVMTTLIQTTKKRKEKNKTRMTVYETVGIKLIRGKIFINYYSTRIMLDSAIKFK